MMKGIDIVVYEFSFHVTISCLCSLVLGTFLHLCEVKYI